MAESRKLATIVSIDVAGYSRAMEKDDVAAAAAVKALRARAGAIAGPLEGRIFSTAGDGLMLEFPTATAGLKAARALVDAAGEPNAALPKIRIGVHLGEVIVAENGDLLGHGVNVAARLQGLAEPGGALVSEAVRAQARAGFEQAFTPHGRVQLDKMDETIAVYSFAAKASARGSAFSGLGFAGGLSSKLTRQRLAKRGWLALAVLLVAALGAIAFWPKPKVRPVLAVLPFAAESETPQARAFAAGFSSELHDLLAQGGSDLTLVGYATSSGFNDAAQQVRALHADMGVTHVLSGAILKAGDTLEASVALIDARNGAQIWRDRFTDSFGNLFALQMRVANRMREVLRLSTDTGSAQAIDPDALRLYMSALGTDLAVPGAAALRDRIEMLKRAVEIQPDFARAWYRLTFAYSNYRFATSDQAAREQARREGQNAAQRYLALAPNEARAHYWAAEFEVDPQQRATLLKQALSLGQRDPEVLSLWSAFLAGAGRTQDAFRMASQAAALDPYSDFVVSRKLWRALALQDLTQAESILTDDRTPVRAAATRWYHVVMGWLAQGETTRAARALPNLETAAATAAQSKDRSSGDALEASGSAMVAELARAAVAAQDSANARRRALALVDQIDAEINQWPVDTWFEALAFVSVIDGPDRAFAMWRKRLDARPPLAVSGVAPDRETGAAYLSWIYASMGRLHRDPRIFALLARYPILREEPFPNEAGALKSMLQLMRDRPPDFCTAEAFPYDCGEALADALKTQ